MIAHCLHLPLLLQFELSLLVCPALPLPVGVCHWCSSLLLPLLSLRLPDSNSFMPLLSQLQDLALLLFLVQLPLLQPQKLWVRCALGRVSLLLGTSMGFITSF